MKKNFTLSALTLVAILGAGLSTAVFARPSDGMDLLQEMNFDAMDADKDGKVTIAEMDAAHAARMKAADANADGKLSAEELAAMHIEAMTERAPARAAKMIENLDTDGDKMVSDVEMAAAKGRDKMFDKIDSDGDGAITKVEADAARERMKGHGRGKGGKHGCGDHDDDQDGTSN